MTPLQLRSKAIRQLVHTITNGPGGYRTAKELEAFFQSIGQACEMARAESRIGYAARVIEEAQDRGQLEPLLVRLVQSGTSEAVREQLRSAVSESLSPYGFTVEGQLEPANFEVKPVVIQMAPPTPEMLSVPAFQNPPFSQEEIALLQDRWKEAVAMYRAGALRMTLLSLSILLEHVLRAYAQRLPDARSSSKAPAHQVPFREWRLDLLLDVAADQNWISLGKEDFPYRMRHHQDYLSPTRELQQGPFLTENLVNDVWWKVKQTLDELNILSLDATVSYAQMRSLDMAWKAPFTPPSPE